MKHTFTKLSITKYVLPQHARKQSSCVYTGQKQLHHQQPANKQWHLNLCLILLLFLCAAMAFLVFTGLFRSSTSRSPPKSVRNAQTPGSVPDKLHLNNFGYGQLAIYRSFLILGPRHFFRTTARYSKCIRTNKSYWKAYLLFLILLAGDVQLNPGPGLVECGYTCWQHDGPPSPTSGVSYTGCYGYDHLHGTRSTRRFPNSFDKWGRGLAWRFEFTTLQRGEFDRAKSESILHGSKADGGRHRVWKRIRPDWCLRPLSWLFRLAWNSRPR